MAAWAMEHRIPAGRGAPSRRIRPPAPPGREPQAAVGRADRYRLYFPIATADQVIGVLEVVGRPGGGRFTAMMSFCWGASRIRRRSRCSGRS